jgi:aspartate racemase
MRDDLLKRIAGLSEEKQRLFLSLLEREGGEVLKSIIVPHSKETTVFPLSFAQERLWLHDEANPGDPFSTLLAAFRVTGIADLDALEKIVGDIVRRHEILRTTFEVRDGGPVQVVSAMSQVALVEEDLRGLPEEERETRARLCVVRCAREPFDLARGPLMRILLLRLGDEDYLLILSAHHIVCDGTSVGVIMREIGAHYVSYLTGLPSSAPELPVQFADFAVWQRRRLAGVEMGRLISYWTGKLAGYSPLWDSPPRPPLPPDRVSDSFYSLRLPRSLSSALGEFASREGVTGFMSLMAALSALLSRYSGREDVLVGTPVSLRTKPELENLVGFISDVVPLRTSLAGDPTLGEILLRVKDACLGAYAHQEMPYHKLLDALGVGFGRSSQPFLQVIFGMHSDILETISSRSAFGIDIRPYEIQLGVSKIDLFIYAWEGEETLTVTVDYNKNLFSEAEIERMMEDYVAILERLLFAPQTRLSALPLRGTVPQGVNSGLKEK